MLWLIVELLLVGYVPGALLLRLPGRTRAYRATLAADERVFWSILFSVVWSTTIAFALALADTYTFNRLLTITAIASGLLVVGLRQHLRFPVAPARLSWAAVVPAGIAVAAIWLYTPPFEYVIGGRDPGTYLNEGIQIAQRGSVVIRDETIATVPPPLRDLFFPSHGMETYYGLRFMGFFIQDPEAGAVVGQWPHFYPASMAIGYGLNGLTGARQAIGVWAVLGLLAVYFTGVRLFGRLAAGSAAALLAINVVMIWFGRYPNSELPMQAMLFGALLAAGRARMGGGVFFAVTCGALLGLALFVRYEVLLAIVAFAAASVLAPVSRLRLGPAFGVALVVTGGLAGWYLVDLMRAYVAYPIGFVDNRGGWVVVVGGLMAAVALNRLLRRESMATAVRRWLPIAIAAAVVVLAVYAYFFREPGGRTALGDAMALRSFGWYVTPWVLALAVAGAAFFIARDLWRDPTFFLTFVTFSTFFFYKTRIVPEHFWTSRRFLGIALPGALLLATALVREAFAPERLERLLSRSHATPGDATPAPRRLAQVASVVLVLAALAPTALAFHRQAAPVRSHVEYAGLIPHLEQLAGRIGNRDLLIIEGRNAGTDLHVLAMPLAYIYARHVLVLESPVPDKRMFEQFIAWAANHYDRVLFLGGGGTDLLSRSVTADPIAADRFQVPEYEAPVNQYPTSARAKEFEYGLYALAAGAPVEPGPIDLQIGGLDDLNVVRFHARERADGGNLVYRWSGAQSFIVVPGLDAATRELTIWMSAGGRPSSEPPAEVEVSIDDVILGRVVVGNAFEPFTFTLDAAFVERAVASGDPAWVRLRVETWSPAAALGVNDTRDLGVMVTRVQAR